jgi:hypothetical protein
MTTTGSTATTGGVPVGLLDFDGVFNASRSGWGGPPVSRTVFVEGTGYRIRWAPQLARAVRDLYLAGCIELRWATSWVGHTSTLEALLGLPHIPDAFPSDVPDILAAKRAAALGVVEAGRRLVWVDDEAFPNTWQPRHWLAGAGHLLIAPNPRRGLREADVQAIAAYCQA